MISLFGNKRIKAFGLDISNASIKIMSLKSREEAMVPEVFADVLLPPKVINNHLIVSEQRLAEAITHAINKAGKLATKYVVASLPEAKSFVRVLAISNMPVNEIEGAIPWELEQDIPVPVDQVYLDWEVIGKTGDKLNLIVAATPKDYVDALVDTLKMAKLKPLAFELESQAIARCLIGAEEKREAVLILDIASTQTSFIIVDSGVLEYTSSIPTAGAALTESIGRNLNISPAEAEKLKKDAGLLTEAKQAVVRKAILPVLDGLVDEIKKVLKFHEEHSPAHKAITKVILSGGSAKLSGIAEYISARLNLGSGSSQLRVQLGNPWVNLSISELDKTVPLTPEQSLGFATAIGLSLRGEKGS